MVWRSAYVSLADYNGLVPLTINLVLDPLDGLLETH
jgi:hypothetical protein